MNNTQNTAVAKTTDNKPATQPAAAAPAPAAPAESQLPAAPAPAAATPPAVIPRTLFNVDIFQNTPNVSKVFGLVATKNKEGVVVAGGLRLDKRRDVAKALELEGKANADKLDAAINQAELDAWKSFKVWLLSQPDDKLGLRAFRSRMLKNGLRRFGLTLDEMSPKDQMTVEKYAASFGLTVEEMGKLMADRARNAQGVVDVAEVK